MAGSDQQGQTGGAGATAAGGGAAASGVGGGGAGGGSGGQIGNPPTPHPAREMVSQGLQMCLIVILL